MIHSKLKGSGKERVSSIDGCPLGGILGSLTGYVSFEVVEGGVTGSAEEGDTTYTDTFNCITNT